MIHTTTTTTTTTTNDNHNDENNTHTANNQQVPVSAPRQRARWPRDAPGDWRRTARYAQSAY